MLSYWERESFTSYDHTVIGAGIVGLSTAIELKSRYPSARVLVLERGLLPTGASSRNAGFACMGSVTELLDDLETIDETEVVALFESRKKGLEGLRRRLGDQAIRYREEGSYELISTREESALEKIEYLNKLLLPVTGIPAFELANDKIVQFGFSKEYARALIRNTCEGSLHTGKMLSALNELALKTGIEIKTGAEMIAFEEDKEHVVLQLRDGFRNETLELKTSSLVLCTNAFTPQLMPEEDVIPGRGQVLITKPVEGLKFKGIFHFDKGYYYFREIDGRVLLGGGRNLDFEGERTTIFELSAAIQSELERKLSEIILPDTPFEIDQRWSGIMAFGVTKHPIVRAFTNRVYGAFRMGGMGVALGTEAARQVADLVQERLR